MVHRLLLVLLMSTGLVACSGDKAGADGSAQGDNGLPKPGAVSGSVTGMPDPGTASAQRRAAQAPDIIELPDQADAADAMAGDVAMQPPAEGAAPVGTFDQAGPELADAPAPEAPPAPNPSEPTPPQQ